MSRYDILCILGCFSGVVILALSKDDHEVKEIDVVDKALSHNLMNKDVTKRQYFFGLACIFTTAMTYSFVGVITRYLREIHFSLMMFHYGWTASCMLLVYMVFV